MLNIQHVSDTAFGRYGRVLEGYDCSRMIKEMNHTPLPADVIYVPSVEELESLPVAKEFANRGFGGLPIQIGYCNGNNKRLNALEYHRSSELNIAVTDMILLVGMQQDITADWTYDTAHVEAFLVPAGHVIEIYATTLHYAPCSAQNGGFKCIVILPEGTNTELANHPEAKNEDRLLTLKNKWLIAHEEAAVEGAFIGLTGVNITLP